ncbi:MAG: hypothetical protein IJE19_00405 [Clostridia bacterium]|nr:hypothetical protein [Clostridia bacterium]
MCDKHCLCISVIVNSVIESACTDCTCIYPKNIKAGNNLLIKLFVEVIKDNPEYKKYIPEINEQTVRKVLSKLNMKVRTQVIVDIVVGRYNRITEKLNK